LRDGILERGRNFRSKRKPFYRLAGVDDTRGIPILSKQMQREHEYKVNRLTQAVSMQTMRELKKAQKERRERIEASMTALRKKREGTAVLYHESGAGWVDAKLARKHVKKRPVVVVAGPTPEELEALEYIKKRDDELKHEELARRAEEKQRLESQRSWVGASGRLSFIGRPPI
jgi:hypothetical protein